MSQNNKACRLHIEQLEVREVPAAFIVNSPLDLADSAPGDGVAWTGAMLPNGQREVTLRAAIMEANASGIQIQQHTISCAPLIAAGAASIILTQPMDEVRVPVVIDGGNKNLLTIKRIQENLFPYFSVATGPFTPKTIAVEFKNMTIRDAQGALMGLGSTGGAINNAAALMLSHVNFLNNKSHEGGAIYNATTGMLTLNSCLLSENETIGAGGEGGAIRATGNSRTTIFNSHFSYNGSDGGKGGAISFNQQSQLSLNNTDLLYNYAAEGGAVYASVGNAEAIVFTMTGGYVYENYATLWGGALFLSTANARIDGTFFDSNSTAKGGAIYSKTNVLQLLNCNFFGNMATVLGPIVAYSGTLGDDVQITLVNCTNITQNDLINDPG